jgi:hypothetical protein
MALSVDRVSIDSTGVVPHHPAGRGTRGDQDGAISTPGASPPGWCAGTRRTGMLRSSATKPGST